MLSKFRDAMNAHVEESLWNLSGNDQLRKMASVVNAAWSVVSDVCSMCRQLDSLAYVRFVSECLQLFVLLILQPCAYLFFPTH